MPFVEHTGCLGAYGDVWGWLFAKMEIEKKYQGLMATLSIY